MSTYHGAYPANSEATLIPRPTPMRLLKRRCKRVVNSEEEARLGEYGEVPL